MDKMKMGKSDAQQKKFVVSPLLINACVVFILNGQFHKFFAAQVKLNLFFPLLSFLLLLKWSH